MTLEEICSRLAFEVKTAQGALKRDVTGGYASDLLSDVMAGAEDGAVWITLQIHENIVAVASLKNLAAIILVNNRKPDESTLRKAEEENLPILVSEMSTFEIAGKLYEMGVRGCS